METETFFAPDAEGSIFGDRDASRVELASASFDAPAEAALRALIDAAQVVVPEGATVVHVKVTPGEVVELPFGPDAHLLARLGDGNLAIKVGDVVIILEGYVAASAQNPPVVETSDGKPLDIATLLASTDPSLDIQTAAGPGGNAGGQGHDNTGGIFQQFGAGEGGLGGFHGAGGQGDSSGPNGGDGPGSNEINNPSAIAGAVNTPAVAADDSFTTDEDNVLVVVAPGMLANDHDPEGDPLSVNTVGFPLAPAHGTVVVGADGSLTYTPNANYHGTDSFNYTVSDGTTTSNTATVTIIVNSVNDAPVAQDDSYKGDEDTLIIIPAPGLLANDTDVDGDKLQVTAIDKDAVHGKVTLDHNGGLVFLPDHDFHGTDSFVYVISDGTTTSKATVHLTINSVPDAPIANDDSYTVDEDHVLSVAAPAGLLFNDRDGDGDPIQVTEIVTAPAHGTITINADGSFNYTPDANFNGTDTFEYKAIDSTGSKSEAATVTITVNSVNDAPVAQDDDYTTNEDTKLTISAPGLLSNDHDVDGDALIANKLVTGPAHGTLFAFTNGQFEYTPDANYHGTDSFSYTAFDGSATSNVATVHLTVNSVPDRPVAEDDAYTTNEDHVLTIAAPGILGNDHDGDGDPVTIDTVGLPLQPAHGSIGVGGDGSLVYTPEANFHGTDSFSYTVTDGTSRSAPATVTITVNSVNDVPVAQDDTIISNQDNVQVPFSALTDNDTDVDSTNLAVDVFGVNGFSQVIVETSPGNKVTSFDDGTPGGSYTYKAVDDDDASSNLATVTVVHQTGSTLTGGAAHEILVGGQNADTFKGGGGNDLIFGNDGDDVVFYHKGDRVDGGSDTATGFNDLQTGLRGDVLISADNLDLNAAATAFTDKTGHDQHTFTGIETVSLLNAESGAAGNQTLMIDAAGVQAMSDHKLTLPAGLGEAPVIQIDADAADQLYLSVSADKSPGTWTDVGFIGNHEVYVHTDNATGVHDAFVLASSAAHATLNQDAP